MQPVFGHLGAAEQAFGDGKADVVKVVAFSYTDKLTLLLTQFCSPPA